MPSEHTGHRITVMETIIPRPPADIDPMRNAFSRMVSNQWEAYVPSVLRGFVQDRDAFQFAKGRFIGEMYARACYSMLLVGARGPIALRVPVRASALLPQSRSLTIRLGSRLLIGMEWLLPRAVHRQLLLTSALVGMLDVVSASSDEAAALRGLADQAAWSGASTANRTGNC